MKNNAKKRAAITSAITVIAVIALYVGIILFAVIRDALHDPIGQVFLFFFTAMEVAAIIGILLALRQRLKEIDKGEEDAAKIY